VQHSVYVGGEHTFNPNFTGAARIGGSYVDYYNSLAGDGHNWGPYALANLRYTYAPQSYVEAGLSQDFSATDVTGVTGTGDNTSFTASQEATVLYGSVNHQITPQLKASLIGQFQYSSFNGGAADGDSERYYLLGLNLSYQFSPHFSTEIGYNYDRLDSDVSDSRTFDRNRVYIGVTGRY
jgi:predicted porin